MIALEGLGRYDHGLVGDLGLMKLLASLRGRWVEAAETAELLAPYDEWQGLAGQFLLLGLVAWPDPGGRPRSRPAGAPSNEARRLIVLSTLDPWT